MSLDYLDRLETNPFFACAPNRWHPLTIHPVKGKVDVGGPNQTWKKCLYLPVRWDENGEKNLTMTEIPSWAKKEFVSAIRKSGCGDDELSLLFKRTIVPTNVDGELRDYSSCQIQLVVE